MRIRFGARSRIRRGGPDHPQGRRSQQSSHALCRDAAHLRPRRRRCSPTRPTTTAASAASCPPGTDGTFNATDFAQFQLLGTYPPHATDQLVDVREPGLRDAGPDRGADPELLQGRAASACRPARTSAPTARAPGVTIVRDSELRHGARLRRDALRHDLRRGLRERRGPPVLHGRAAPRRAAASCPASPAARTRRWTPRCGRTRPTPRPTCRSRSTRPTTSTAPRARRSSRTSPTTSPASTSTSPRPASTRPRCRTSTRRSASRSRTGRATDVIATAALIGGIFGKGGGNEVGSAVVLEEAKDRFGGAAGEQAWRDFRRQDDPEAPDHRAERQRLVRLSDASAAPAGVALPDEGSLVDPPEQRLDAAGARGRAAVRRPAAAERHVERAARLRRGVGVRPPGRRDGPAGRLLHAADPARAGPARARHRRPGRRLRGRQPLRAARAAARTTPGRPPRRARTSSTRSPRSSASPTARSPTSSPRTTSTRASAARWRSSPG